MIGAFVHKYLEAVLAVHFLFTYQILKFFLPQKVFLSHWSTREQTLAEYEGSAFLWLTVNLTFISPLSFPTFKLWVREPWELAAVYKTYLSHCLTRPAASMALAGQRLQFGIEKTGQTCHVPDNDVARLMYYLNCKSCVSLTLNF